MISAATVKELQSFLGLANYYRRHIHSYADTATPLYQLLQKTVPYQWSSTAQQSFDKLNGLIKSKLESNHLDDWKNVKYMIFDSPSSKLPFESRMKQLNLLSLPNHALFLEREECLDHNHLQSKLELVMEKGGEGLMLNEPKSLYVCERTESLLKVKVIN